MSGTHAHAAVSVPGAHRLRPAEGDRLLEGLLLDSVNRHPGLVGLELDLETAWLTAYYDPAVMSFRTAEDLARAIGVHLLPRLEGCPAARRAGVCVDAAVTAGRIPADPAHLVFASASADRLRGFPSVRHRLRPLAEEEEAEPFEVSGEFQLMLAGICLAALLLSIPAERVWPGSRWVSWGLATVAYLSGGALSTLGAVHALARYQLDIDSLMIIGALGAGAIGRWREGAVLLFLFSLSNALEALGMKRTRGAIRSLVSLSPEEAVVRRDGGERKVAIRDLQPGDLVAVRPGERIPIDGAVREGESDVDGSMLTGEARWVRKTAGDPVFAGTLNQTGVLLVATTRLPTDTYLARIVRLVEAAQSTKARLHRAIDAFGRVYTPCVLLVSAAVFVWFWWRAPGGAYDAFYRSMVVLVVMSPCALILATPATILSAIGHGAREGILFKGGVFVERLASVRTMAFDKTGILTAGTPVVARVHGFGRPEAEVLAVAAALEREATHPLAMAIVAAARAGGAEPAPARSLVTHHGRGVSGLVDGRAVWAGNEALAVERKVPIGPAVDAVIREHAEEGRTLVLVGTEAGVIGVIALADETRAGAAAAMTAVRRLGLRPLIMVTGDRPVAARRVADALGLDEAHAGLLPDEKLRVIRQLREREGAVAMVGDGINDGPALAAADVGITLGMASEVALEVSDIVLVTNDLGRLPYALALARKARRVVTQNLVIAAGVIVVALPLALAGVISLPLGVVMHEGSTLVVVANGLRLLRGLRKEAA